MDGERENGSGHHGGLPLHPTQAASAEDEQRAGSDAKAAQYYGPDPHTSGAILEARRGARGSRAWDAFDDYLLLRSIRGSAPRDRGDSAHQESDESQRGRTRWVLYRGPQSGGVAVDKVAAWLVPVPAGLTAPMLFQSRHTRSITAQTWRATWPRRARWRTTSPSRFAGRCARQRLPRPTLGLATPHREQGRPRGATRATTCSQALWTRSAQRVLPPARDGSATRRRRGRPRRSWTGTLRRAYSPLPRPPASSPQRTEAHDQTTRTFLLRHGRAALRPGPAWRTWRPHCRRTITCWTRYSAWSRSRRTPPPAASTCPAQASLRSGPQQAPHPRARAAAMAGAGAARGLGRAKRCSQRSTPAAPARPYPLRGSGTRPAGASSGDRPRHRLSRRRRTRLIGPRARRPHHSQQP